MKHRMIMLFALLLCTLSVQAEEISVTVYQLDSNGLGPSAGVIVARDSGEGLVLTPYLRGLPPGKHVFTINENVGCGVAYNSDGTRLPGMAAGPAIGALPMLEVNERGEATSSVIAPNLTLDQIRGRTLVVHQGEKADRVACGSLELYSQS